MKIYVGDAKKTIKAGAKNVAGKATFVAQKLTDEAALRLKIRALKIEREEKFTLLGKLTYKKSASDTQNIKICAKISETIEEIKALSAQIKELSTK